MSIENPLGERLLPPSAVPQGGVAPAPAGAPHGVSGHPRPRGRMGQILMAGRWINRRPGERDIFVDPAKRYAVSRTDLGPRRKAPIWMRGVQRASHFEIRKGDPVPTDGWVYVLWLPGPEGLDGRCKIIALANEARWPERLKELDEDGQTIRSVSYPRGARTNAAGERLPSVPAISRIWVAEVYRRNWWGTRLAQAVMRHHNVGTLAWRTPLTAGGLGLAKATSLDGSVWGW